MTAATPARNRPLAGAIHLVLLVLLSLGRPALAGYADPPPIPQSAAAMTALARTELEKAQAGLDQILAVRGPRTIENTLLPYNEMSMHLDLAGSMSGLMENVHPDKDLRAAAEQASQEVSDFVTKLGLNRPLYDAMKAVDMTGADAATSYMVEKALRNFRRSGVDRDEPTRKKVEQLNADIVRVGQTFQRNIREGRRTITLDSPKQLDGLPQDFIDSHPPDASGRITVSTDYPDYFPIQNYAKDGSVRQRLYTEFLKRGNPGNLAELDTLLALRWDLARTLGYDSWADFVTEDKMIGSAANAAAFIDRIAEAAGPPAQAEYQELLAVKKRFDETATEVADYDKFFLSDILKREKYNFDSQEVREYFDYPLVKDGILNLTSHLFNVQFRRIPDAPVWHPDVECYEVWDGPRMLGRLYLDMHPREGKYQHAAQFTMRTGVKDVQCPIGVLVCNFPGGADAKPGEALMSHDDVATGLHEFGHLLHHIFGGNQRWIDQSGVATEWDFVEAPSQLLEEWAWDKDALQTFARHWKTGQPIPADLVGRMRAARDFSDFGKGLYVRHQMFYADLCLELHDRNPASIPNTTALVEELQDKYSFFKKVPGTTMQTSFGHIQGYSAMYYTYMWSLVIAKDLFSGFDGRNLLDPSVAQRYRWAVLAPGGTRPASVLVKDFLGRDFSFDSYGKWLSGK